MSTRFRFIGGWLRFLRRALLWTLLGLLMFSLASVLALRWIDPPLSAVMAQHWLNARLADQPPPRLPVTWVAWDEIAQPVALAVLAGEDQRFPNHRGFDFIEMRAAWRAYRQGGRLRGASTISQQTAKNLFLWNGRDYGRKLLEAWFTLLLETFWPKQRILEVYLNIAQFGPDIFGIGAASWRYFNRPPSALDARRAALLAAVLPNPTQHRVEAPSALILRRAARIRRDMRYLADLPEVRRVLPNPAAQSRP